MRQSSTEKPHRELWIRPARVTEWPNIRKLIQGVFAEYGLPPDPCGDDRDLDDIDAFYTANGGRFEVLVDAEENVLGTVGLLALGDGRCELRKMYFSASLRGQGWGKVLLDRMIRIARNADFSVMELKTATVLVEAIGLYQRFGFQPAAPGAAPRCDRAFSLRLSEYEPPELPARVLHEGLA